MRVNILSDLHLEFFGREWRRFIDAIPTDCDVLVLAGDITSMAGEYTPEPNEVLVAACARFKHVLFVAGNHEYYGSSPHVVHDELSVAVELCGGQLHWLNRSAVTIDGVRFLGGTLWFRYPPAWVNKDALSDYSQIRDFEPWVYEVAAMTRLYLHENLRQGDVVITHHLPSHKSVHPKYTGSPLNAFFVSDEEDLIVERAPALWIHGHTHESCDYYVGPTRVVCNPYGYHGFETNPKFDPGFVVEVSGV